MLPLLKEIGAAPLKPYLASSKFDQSPRKDHRPEEKARLVSPV
jgi:hypothetical protein